MASGAVRGCYNYESIYGTKSLRGVKLQTAAEFYAIYVFSLLKPVQCSLKYIKRFPFHNNSVNTFKDCLFLRKGGGLSSCIVSCVWAYYKTTYFHILSHVSPNVRIIRDKCSVHHTTIVLYMRIQIMSAEWEGVKIPLKLWKGKAMGGSLQFSSTIVNKWPYFTIFSCPGQLNMWPCQSVRQTFDFWH